MPTFTIYADVETGGLEPHHPTIQIAAIAVDDTTGEEVACFDRKLQFNEADADPKALEMNHYDAAVWAKEAVSPSRAADDFARFAKPYASIIMISKRTGAPYQVSKLAGHNALTFDLPRIRQMFGSGFFPFSYHVKDTLQRALFFYDEHPEVPRPESLKLSVLCASFGISTDNAHSPLADVRMSAALAFAFREAERNGH